MMPNPAGNRTLRIKPRKAGCLERCLSMKKAESGIFGAAALLEALSFCAHSLYELISTNKAQAIDWKLFIVLAAPNAIFWLACFFARSGSFAFVLGAIAVILSIVISVIAAHDPSHFALWGMVLIGWLSGFFSLVASIIWLAARRLSRNTTQVIDS